MFETFGGKRAVALRAWTAAAVLLSNRRRFVRALDAPVQRLVFVCAGNICRSAFGEQAARRVGLAAMSMGLNAQDGVPAHPLAAARARLRGIDLDEHVARRLDRALVHPGDLVLAFEVDHAQRIESLLRGTGVPVRLLGAFAGPLLYHQHDPYGLSVDYFDRCFAAIEDCVAGLAETAPISSQIAAP